jgi:hypothetical protein
MADWFKKTNSFQSKIKTLHWKRQTQQEKWQDGKKIFQENENQKQVA